MKQIQNKQAFTLVELIVVITILAILGTIAFISLQGYSAQARDSKRLSDISNIKKSLELFSLNTGKYPEPDDKITVSYSGETLRFQGTVGDQVSTNLSRNLNEKPTDPSTGLEYTYSTTHSQTEYEVLGLYESDLIGLTSPNSPHPNPFPKGEGTRTLFISSTNAAIQDYPKIDGNYNGIYIKTSSFYVPTPSIINGNIWGDVDFVDDETLIKSQVISGGDNLPLTSTGWLNVNFSLYEGTITSDSTDEEKIELVEAIKTAYSNSQLANDTIYADILSRTSTGDLVDFVDVVVLNNVENTSNISGGDIIPPLTGWRILDSNCLIDDIHIPEGCEEGTEGCQIWAGCNSTLGDGIEYTSEEHCYNYDKDGNLTNDDLGSLLACGAGNLGDSNDSALDYYDSLSGDGNSNGDIEFDTIWGKLYTWDSLDTDTDNDIDLDDTNLVCGVGYHIPSDEEWYDLEVLLGSITRSISGDYTGIRDGWYSDGLGWGGHNAKDNTNNLANALKLPLSGYHNNDGSTFGYRGYNTYLWSSTPNNSSAYIRYMLWSNSTIRRYVTGKDNGFSVRCIKD